MRFKQRALAAAGRPHDRREVPRLELERDLVESDDAAVFERLRDTVDDDIDAAVRARGHSGFTSRFRIFV